MNQYFECRVCSEKVDVSVPAEICPFCRTTAGRKLGEQARQVAGIGTLAVSQTVVPMFSNQHPITYGALDLYVHVRHEHIESTNSAEKIGELTRPIANVTTSAGFVVVPITGFQTTTPSA